MRGYSVPDHSKLYQVARRLAAYKKAFKVSVPCMSAIC
jgi:hypothetical protein